MFSHLGCRSELAPEWPYLCCRACLTPPPRARRVGPRVPGRPVQQPPTGSCAAASETVKPSDTEDDEDTSTEEEEDSPDAGRSEDPLLLHAVNADEFELWIDGSGGDDVWGVGLVDARIEFFQSLGGRNKSLGALRDMGERCNYCDGHMAEGLGLYCALSYAWERAVTATGGGIIVCDRTAALKNLIDKPLRHPVRQMVLDLIRHAMLKALAVHRYVTFVHKKCYGYDKNWLPDKLAKSGRKRAEELDNRIHVPCPLESGRVRFVDPLWMGRGENHKVLLMRVTIVRDE